MDAAKASDWKTSPLPTKRTTILLDRKFSPAEIAVIRRGVIPEDMADKWFLYWQDDALHCHRSWTGVCIYVARFAAEGDGYRLHAVDVNRDWSQYRETDDDADAQKLAFLIDVLLLHRELEFPGPGGVIEGWGFAGRALLGEHPDQADDAGEA